MVTRSKSPQNTGPRLDQVDVTALKGVGKQLAGKLNKIQLFTIQDLLFHLPLRYIDRTRITPIGSVQPNTNTVIEGEIRLCNIVFARRRSLMCRIQDGTGTLTLRFYHFSKAQKERLKPGIRIRCFGESRRGASGLELYHPEYEFLDENNPLPLEQSLTPIYPATEGITQQRIRNLVQQALDLLNKAALQELLPAQLLSQHQQSDLISALAYLHHPPKDAPLALLLEGEHPYQKRLAFEELLSHHLSLLRVRQRLQAQQGPALEQNIELTNRFLSQLAFKLTQAQQRTVAEIQQDMTQPIPMLRLVQGDVGSGKTVVAALAAIQAVANGYQAAVMAPTEILAEQHRQNFMEWLAPLGIDISWLTGRQKAAQKRAQIEAIGSGQAQIVIGTHALFQEDVNFSRLGLVIIDEQHRFGVHQRLSLKQKGEQQGWQPHQLIMTATPIPRTLAMSAYADLDYSVIDELPPGRTPVTTVAIDGIRREQVIERVRHACLEGRQAYWVCTLIEESESLEAQAAEATAQELTELLDELSVGLIHGRLKPAEKEAVMSAFSNGDINLLVATTVIEVGVNVPNASLMVIENPERLGLAQLHQLRGRVGRGSQASHCVLLYNPPLSQHSQARLNAMRETNDGFTIAETDLKLRGPGEVLGTRQTGEMQFKIADLQRDADLLEDVKRCAKTLLQQHPQLQEPLIRRWLGTNELYAQV